MRELNASLDRRQQLNNVINQYGASMVQAAQAAAAVVGHNNLQMNKRQPTSSTNASAKHG